MKLAGLARRPSTIAPQPSRIEVLENRIALNASPLQIAKALDLPAGTAVIYTGDASAVSAFTFETTNGFIGFPSGADNDFLVLSSGVASGVTGANTSGSQGTDLGETGVAGDKGTISFTINVPVSTQNQKFKFDFVFLSEEFPEYVGSQFNDIFTATVNGSNVAKDQFGNVISVNNAFFSGESAAGTIFDGRTSKLTAAYNVPAGTATLDIVLTLEDVGDGIYDSAIFIDNVRFEKSQVIFVDFDGRTVVNHFGAGTSVNIPAFQAADVKSNASTASVIATIMDGLRAKYAAYDVVFTTTEPTSGVYSTLVIGGDNDLPVDLSAATEVFRAQFASATPSLREVYGIGGTLFGAAAAVDIGNTVRNDLGVIFSGVFDNFYSAETADTITNRLIVTAAHELGHNLGLRHVVNTHPEDILKKNSPRNSDATFGGTQLQLAEAWSDGATTQNDDAYLKSILGASDGNTTLTQAFVSLNDFLAGFLGFSVFDFTLIFNTSDDNDSDTGFDTAPIVMNFDKFDASTQVTLPILPLGTTFSFFGSSKKGGPTDLYSGNPQNGNLSYGDTFFNLFDANGDIAVNVPITKGSVGDFELLGMAAFSENAIPSKSAKYTDADGDTVTVKVSGPGLVSVELNDPDGDCKGSIDRIVLNGTDPKKTTVTIDVKKFKGGGGFDAGDGFVSIGEIVGIESAGLKALTAKKSDLVGAGIDLDGPVGAITLRDILNGADISTGLGAAKAATKVTVRNVDSGSALEFGTKLASFTAELVGDASVAAPEIAKITFKDNFGGDINVAGLLGSLSAKDILSGATVSAGGTPAQKTKISARAIADGVSFDLGSTVTAFHAASVGDGLIEAASIASLLVKGDKKASIAGDFASDITLSGEVQGGSFNNVLASVKIAGRVEGVVILAENVGSFTGNTFENSTLFAGYTPTSLLDPLGGGTFVTTSAIKSFLIKSTENGFVNSFVGSAEIGAAKIASLVQANGGTRFGFITDTIIASLKVTDPDFAFDKDGSPDQSIGDFHVIRV